MATIQYTLMVGLCITYSVTAGQSLKGMASSKCNGKDCQEVRQGWVRLEGCGGWVSGCVCVWVLACLL